MKQLSPRTHVVLSATLFVSAVAVVTISCYAAAVTTKLLPGIQAAMVTIAFAALVHLCWLFNDSRRAAAKPLDMETKAKVTLTILDMDRGIEIRGVFDPAREPGKETPAQMLAILAIDHIEHQMSAAAFDANAKPIIHREGI